MKRALVIVLTIAILGGLSVYARNQQSSASVKSANTSSNISVSSGQSSSSGTSSNSSVSSTSSQSGSYKEGTFKGDAAETPYGTVQIAVVISGGKIVNVNFLQMPNDQPHSREVTNISGPLLKQSTLNNQSSNIEFVSGATSTSYGYQESLQAALDQAKLS